MILKPPWELATPDGLIRLNDLMVWCWMILKVYSSAKFYSAFFSLLVELLHGLGIFAVLHIVGAVLTFRYIKGVDKHMEPGWSKTENSQASYWAPIKYSLKRFRPGDVKSSDLTVSWNSGFYLCYKRTVFLNSIKEHKELSFLKSCMGIRMGNTCKSMADSCQCMTKTTIIL